VKIVVDTNCIISALLKNGASRELLLKKRLNLFTPETARKELERHEEYILKKAHLSEASFRLIFNLLFEKMAVIEKAGYAQQLNYAKSLISDPEDAPFLALAMAKGAAIWSEDKHFLEQDEVKVLTTSEMLEL